MARNISASARRRFAESSSVRSSHWLAAVCAVFPRVSITKRPRAQIRSLRIGLRFHGMAEEPICFEPNGSSTSRRLASRRRSVANLCVDCAIEDSTWVTRKSSLRG